MDIGVPVGTGGVTGHVNKRWSKKQTIWDNFLLQRQINQQSINIQSDKMDFADVNDT